jgi:hypothetical protein
VKPIVALVGMFQVEIKSCNHPDFDSKLQVPWDVPSKFRQCLLACVLPVLYRKRGYVVADQ